VYLIPLYAHKSSSISYAVGSQDSLGYFYADQLEYNNSQTYYLLNIKYIFALQEENFSSIGTLIYKNDKYALYGVNQSPGYFDLIQSNTVLFADNKNARPAVLQWTNSSWIADKEFLSIADNIPKEAFVNLNYTSFYSLNDEISFPKNTPKQSCGKINSETADSGIYTANVSMTSSCFVLLKVGAHKDWHVTVDGQEQQWIQVSPAFMAVPVSEGNHKVVFQFAISRLRIFLFIFSLLTVFAIWIYDKKHNVVTK
jgi:uncharacterized membrane protein YfhO